MPYAYRNAAGDILALSTVERTLAEAQAVNPEIVTVDPNPSEAELAAYYDAIAFIEAKRAKGRAVDKRTEELLEEGFVGTTGKRFHLDDPHLLQYIGLWITRDLPTASYPVVVNTYENQDIQNLPSATAVDTFFKEAFGAVRVQQDAGSALKISIRNATTWEELAAVVDNR